MSEKESSVYQKKINELKQNSSLFNATYSYLEKSKDIYPVQFGETSKNSSGESVDGDFVPNKNGCRTITLLKGKEIQIQSLSEEVVHAFRNENREFG